MNARTRVHEYGGGEYLIHQGEAFFQASLTSSFITSAPAQRPG